MVQRVGCSLVKQAAREEQDLADDRAQPEVLDGKARHMLGMSTCQLIDDVECRV